MKVQASALYELLSTFATIGVGRLLLRERAAMVDPVQAARELAQAQTAGPSTALGIAWAGHGGLLATAHVDATVRLWDPSSGTCAQVMTGHRGCAWGVAFDAVGTSVVSSAEDATIRIWDAKIGNETAVFQLDRPYARRVAFHPDGTSVVACGADGGLWIWRIDGSEHKTVIRAHDDPVIDIAFSPNGTSVATATKAGSSAVWELATGQRLVVFPERRWAVEGVAFDPTGTHVATTCSDGVVHIHAATDGSVVRAIDTDEVLGYSSSGLRAIAYSPSGSHLAFTSHSQLVLWNLADDEVDLVIDCTGQLWDLAFDPSGRWLASAGHSGTPTSIWSVDTGEPNRTLEATATNASKVRFAASGSFLAIAGTGGTRICDPELREVRIVDEGERWVRTVASHPTQAIIATSSLGGPVRVWDADQGVATLTLDECFGVEAVVFDPGGTRLATTSRHGAQVWDVASGQQTHDLRQDSHDHYSDVAFHPSGDLLAALGSSATLIWRLSTDEVVTSLPSPGGAMSALAFDPSGDLLATAGYDGTVRVWHHATAEVVRTFTHQAWVKDVQFHPCEAWLATASYDGTARVWDLDTSEEIRVIENVGWVDSVAFHPTDDCLASAGSGVVLLSPITGAGPPTKAVARDGRWLTLQPDGGYDLA